MGACTKNAQLAHLAKRPYTALMMFREEHTLSCLRLLLKPVVRFALRNSVSVQQLIETLKGAVVSLAAEEMSRSGEKVNVSRLSAMTGLHRRDVQRLNGAERLPDLPAPLAARVVGRWENDARFCSKNGRPRVLRIDSEKNELLELLEVVGTDLNPGTVLFELERSGLVERRPDSIKLLRAHVVPKADVMESFRIVEQDCDDLIRTVEQNVTVEPEERNLHGRTEYTNISRRDANTIRRWLIQEGGAFHKRARGFLSSFDRDLHPERGTEEESIRVSVSTFSRIEETIR